MNIVPWTVLRTSLVVFLAFVPIACGGSVEETPKQTSGDGMDAAPDALQEKESCNPFGTWSVSYQVVDAGYCAPMSDTITIEKDVDAGGVVVNWESGKQSDFGCGSGDSSTYTHPASLSADGCTLTAASHARWCMMGESQCNKRDLTLKFAGNSASGTVTYSACWCPGPGESTPAQYVASAVRK